MSSSGQQPGGGALLQVKSQHRREYRRFSVNTALDTYRHFRAKIELLYRSDDGTPLPMHVTYREPRTHRWRPIVDEPSFIGAMRSCAIDSAMMMRIRVSPAHPAPRCHHHRHPLGVRLRHAHSCSNILDSLAASSSSAAAVANLRRVIVTRTSGAERWGVVLNDGGPPHVIVALSGPARRQMAPMGIGPGDQLVKVNSDVVAGTSRNQVDRMLDDPDQLQVLLVVRPAARAPAPVRPMSEAIRTGPLDLDKLSPPC